MFSRDDFKETSELIGGLHVQRVSTDLSLDDFRDEDLTEITEEDTMRFTVVDGKINVNGRAISTSREISEYMKKRISNSVELNLTGKSSAVLMKKDGFFNGAKIPNERPQTLNIFSTMTHEVLDQDSTYRKEDRKSVALVSTISTANILGDDDYMKSTTLEWNNRMDHTSSNRKSTTFQHSPTRNASEWSIDDPESVDYCYLNGKMKKQTHVAAFKFVPRHPDEVRLDIYDPLHVNFQGVDLWCKGLNMRTGECGLFPSYYAQSVRNSNNELPEGRDDSWKKFFLYLIGSVEVPCRTGSGILCQAMYKVAEERSNILQSNPPTYVCLKIGKRGVKIINRSELKRFKSRKYSSENKLFCSSREVQRQTHFFQLRNVSFCGHHPRNDRYFAFISRHPNECRFACHTFLCERSTRPIIDCFGVNFAKRSQECYNQPPDDMYLE